MCFFNNIGTGVALPKVKWKKNRTKEDSFMFKFKETFNRLMATITFAEANEHEIALDILHDRPEKKRRKRDHVHIRPSEEVRPQVRM